MAAHTPGPWWVDADGTDGDGVPVIRNFRAGSGNTQWGIGTVWHHSGGAMDDSETIANANLMAAAPALFEALKAQRCFQCVDSEPDDDVCDVCRLRRAALKKAGVR
jgi:hypothetical protein